MDNKLLLHVLAIVKKEVERQVSKIPPPKAGKDAEIPQQLLKSLIDDRVSAIPPARPGKDAIIPKELISQEVARAVKALPLHKPSFPEKVSPQALQKVVQAEIQAQGLPDIEIGEVTTVDGSREDPKVEVEKTSKGWKLKFKIPVWRDGRVWPANNLQLINVITAGTMGDATHVPRITYDAQGRLRGVTEVAITAAASEVYVQASTPSVTSPAVWYQSGQYANPNFYNLWVYVP